MLKPDLAKWGQTREDIQQLALSAEHQRTRERFLLLEKIVTRWISTTQAAVELGRDPHTAMRWVHRYNAGGPAALTYERTGGRPPLSARRSSIRSDAS
jgi:transposase